MTKDTYKNETMQLKETYLYYPKKKKEETHLDIKQCSCNRTGTTQKKIISNFSLWYLRIFIQRMRLRGSHSLPPHSHFELVRGYIYIIHSVMVAYGFVM